ncbi:hypothetical protein MKW94_023897 [Papaver nudicaule]|uniref:Uncharacterized protein n=1 Tax=Papaver nudicaule TaxID=74823 RepID=A0AA41VDZ5_PAPNU|nr:hypothetical protein [Papaver nudicaule]
MGSEEVLPVSSSIRRRRNSFPSSMVLDIPIQLQTNEDKVSSSLDFELFSFKPSSSSSAQDDDDKYTSLKDLMPYSLSAAAQSPTGSMMIQPISIRNRLVKQAAWAYLQPMSSSSPGSSSGNSIKRMWFRFENQYVKNPINACLDFIKRRFIPMVSRVFDRLISWFNLVMG